MYTKKNEEKAMVFMSSVELNNAYQNIHMHSSGSDSSIIIVIVSVDMHHPSSLFDRMSDGE